MTHLLSSLATACGVLAWPEAFAIVGGALVGVVGLYIMLRWA